MRQFVVAVSLMSAVVGGSAFASGSFEEKPLAWPHLRALTEPEIVVHPGPELATVQPWAEIKFSFVSCGERNWTVERHTDHGVTLLQVVQKDTADCPGPVSKINYAVQISADTTTDGQYLLLNPTSPKQRTER